jgi:hypothetical protein
MATIEPRLFSWQDVEARCDLDRFFLVRDYLPDTQIIHYLEVMRSKGRDDFPVRAMWNALIAGIVFQHASLESLIRGLSRNLALFEVCGFDVLPRQKKPTAELVRDPDTGGMTVVWSAPGEAYYGVPDSCNFSRFLSNVIELEETLGLITAMVPQLREHLMEVLPDFGQHLGYDGKAVESHSTGQVSRRTGETSDPQADWGKHETVGIDSHTGKPWTKIKSWFGYGVHLIADTHYEIPVAVHVTPASASEQVELRAMIRETFAQSPALAARCQDFSADRGLDCAQTKALLWDDYHIRPLIDVRELWRAESRPQTLIPPNRSPVPLIQSGSTPSFTRKRARCTVSAPQTAELRDLAFQGFETDSNTLKYRCPAAAYGLECKGQDQCHQAGDVRPGEYGRIVRINITQQDRRIFVPTPYAGPSWRRGYHRRSALERINNRIDHSFGFEQHFIRGKAKMQTRVGLALAVMMAMALGHVKCGRRDQMRSLVRPFPATG